MGTRSGLQPLVGEREGTGHCTVQPGRGAGGCSRSIKHLVGFAAFERKTGWNSSDGFLNPALFHTVFLERIKQGTVCGRFPSHRSNPPPLGEGRVRRDLEERHGEQLEISGKL